MMVIRNVTVPGGGLRKITWGGGYDAPFIDLGSGKAAVVNPTTGTQSKNCDLPDDVPGVVALLRDMMGLPPLPKIAATGKWRDNPTMFAELTQSLGVPVELLQQDDEAELAAQCARSILSTQSLGRVGLTLYVEAGRGSTQFTVLDGDGTIVYGCPLPPPLRSRPLPPCPLLRVPTPSLLSPLCNIHPRPRPRC